MSTERGSDKGERRSLVIQHWWHGGGNSEAVWTHSENITETQAPQKERDERGMGIKQTHRYVREQKTSECVFSFSLSDPPLQCWAGLSSNTYLFRDLTSHSNQLSLSLFSLSLLFFHCHRACAWEKECGKRSSLSNNSAFQQHFSLTKLLDKNTVWF